MINDFSEVIISCDILDNKSVGDFIPYVCTTQTLSIYFNGQIQYQQSIYNVLNYICHFTNITYLYVNIDFLKFNQTDESQFYHTVQRSFPFLEILVVNLENVTDQINTFFSRISQNIEYRKIYTEQNSIDSFQMKQLTHFQNIKKFSLTCNFDISGYQYLENIIKTTKKIYLNLINLNFKEKNSDFSKYLGQFISSSENLESLEIHVEKQFLQIQFLLKEIKKWPISLNNLFIRDHYHSFKNLMIQDQFQLDYLDRITPQLLSFSLNLGEYLNCLSRFNNEDINNSSNQFLQTLGEAIQKCQNLQILKLVFGGSFQGFKKSFLIFFSKIAVKGLKNFKLLVKRDYDGYFLKEQNESENFQQIKEEESGSIIIQENEEEKWIDYQSQIQEDLDFSYEFKILQELILDEEIKEKQQMQKEQIEEMNEGMDISEDLKIQEEMTNNEILQDQEQMSEDQDISSNQNLTRYEEISQEILQNVQILKKEENEEDTQEQQLILFLIDQLYQNCKDSLKSLKIGFQVNQTQSYNRIIQDKIMRFKFLSKLCFYQNLEYPGEGEYEYEDKQLPYFYEFEQFYKNKKKLIFLLKKMNDISKHFQIRKEIFYNAINKFIIPFNSSDLFEIQ